jgi:exonuclease III
MHETGKQVIRELRACKLHLLGIRECRWTGCGKRITSTGETIAYSGRNDEKQYGRVAIIMNRHVTKAILEHASVNERAPFQAKQEKLTIIQCYAPTNEADNVEKTDLYLALQSEIEKVPKHDVTIVMGDLNAKVGNDNTGNERVMGKYGMVTSTTMANA